ncbi:acyltransferase domain-containing protein [Ditylenchus destructor]|uniref:Acyltransferase domain-containing protein n=1 Tax=Ditylenchus destructor TaxID=166010 RepID=A0AAD4NET7_9BILA|nr:acyltransferase domain-containing protein [Ditylenchus destructor]
MSTITDNMCTEAQTFSPLLLTSTELGYAVIFFSGVLLASFTSRVRESYINILMYLFEWSRTSKSHAQHDSQPDDITTDETLDCIDMVLSKTNDIKNPGWLAIEDSLYFIMTGVEAIIEDEVTTRFQAEKLKSWNMLTRSIHLFQECINWKLKLIWALGIMLRYFVLLPFPTIHFHGQENKAKNGGICVANHTSPIDVLMLGTDNIYALIGQRHSGFLGIIQSVLSRASSHIWFERTVADDRKLVISTLREHVDNPSKLPVLIFPEGTCINNTSVMMFKKGSFEVGAKIYPIAMKYDSRFGDAFWNSSEQSWVGYMMQMITSWAIICHVWYLPPMEKMENEDAIDFASRVKKAIARRAGLLDLEWDGQLKRSKIPPKLIAEQQERYYQQFLLYLS